MATKVKERTDGEYMSPAELAWVMGVSVGTVRNWISSGEVPSFKIGRARRIRREDIDALIRQRLQMSA